MKNLSNEDLNTIREIVSRASRKELDYCLAIVEKEIRLSERCIVEGFEADNRDQKCEFCSCLLEKSEDDCGAFLYCQNEMCLNEMTYRLSDGEPQAEHLPLDAP